MNKKCEEFSHKLMQVNTEKSMDNVAIFTAIILDIDTEADEKTASIEYVTGQNNKYSGIITENVPFFYHCEFSDGSEEDLAKGYLAFSEDDLVYVYYFYSEGEEFRKTYIVGHADIPNTRYCCPDFLRIVLKNDEVLNVPKTVTYINAQTGDKLIPKMSDGSDPGFTFPTYLDNILFINWEDDVMEEYIPEDDFSRDYFTRVSEGDMIKIGDGTDWVFDPEYYLQWYWDYGCIYETTDDFHIFIHDQYQQDMSDLQYLNKFGEVISELVHDYDLGYVEKLFLMRAHAQYVWAKKSIYCTYTCEDMKQYWSTNCASYFYNYGMTETNLGIIELNYTGEIIGLSIGDDESEPVLVASDGYTMSGDAESYDLWYFGNAFIGVHRTTIEIYINNYDNYGPSSIPYMDDWPPGSFDIPEKNDDAKTSISLTHKKTNYIIVAPWNEEPHFEKKLVLVYNYNTDYIKDTSYEIEDIDEDGYTDFEKVTIVKADTRVPVYDDQTNERRLPLNSCDLAIGKHGIYGVSAVFAFNSSYYAKWTRIELHDGSVVSDINEEKFTFDNRLYGVNVSVNYDTALYDELSGDSKDIFSNFTANEYLTSALNDFLEEHINEIYPEGDISFASHYLYGNYFWVMETKIFHYKNALAELEE